MSDFDRRTVNVDEAGEMLGVHGQTVRVLIRDGRLGAVRVGKRFLIPIVEIDSFLERELRKVPQ